MGTEKPMAATAPMMFQRGGNAVDAATAMIAPACTMWATVSYGPIAAFLIESFPAKIRYTSFSLPYHIGNGWFGGTLPLLAGVVVAETHNNFAGLYWPIGVALMTFVIGTFVLSESHRTEIWQEAEEARPA